MIDIEKELRSIKTEYRPDESLRRRTRSMVTGEAGKKKAGNIFFRKAALIYSSAAAFVLILALCISLLTAAPAKAAGYYTIDINPSISVAVDKNNVVLSVSPEDEDAAVMLEGLDMQGMQFEDALKAVLQAAKQKDYLKDSGHVLVAYFGDGEGVTQDEINCIVNEQLPQGKVNTLALNGSADDYNNAKKSGKKAGIELLLSSADAAGIEEKDPDTVINIMSDKLNDEKDKPDKDKDKDKEKDNNKDKDKEKENSKDKGSKDKND